MRKLLIGLLVAVAVVGCSDQPEHIPEGAGLNVACPALCSCEPDAEACEASCLATNGWTIKPACLVGVANCVLDAEADGTCVRNEAFDGTRDGCSRALYESSVLCR